MIARKTGRRTSEPTLQTEEAVCGEIGYTESDRRGFLRKEIQLMPPKVTDQFRAVSGLEQGFGPTPQEALNALLPRLPEAASAPIVIWAFNRGDAFFTEAQEARLQELKARRETLTEAERAEWEALVEAAFDATVARTQTLPLVKS